MIGIVSFASRSCPKRVSRPDFYDLLTVVDNLTWH